MPWSGPNRSSVWRQSNAGRCAARPPLGGASGNPLGGAPWKAAPGTHPCPPRHAMHIPMRPWACGCAVEGKAASHAAAEASRWKARRCCGCGCAHC
eukprot:scaffold5181_cov125-Isochrysis_galbana.AAC.2